MQQAATQVLQQRSRPLLVWVIAIFFSLSVLWTAVSFYLIFSESSAIDPRVRESLMDQSLATWALAGVGTAATLGGVVTLFMLRKSAVAWLAVGLLLQFFNLIHHLADHEMRALIFGSTSTAVGACAGTALSIAVLLYAKRLEDRRVLT